MVTVRDASQIPLLAAGCAVLGIVFIALAAYALRSIWRAGVAARNGRALVLGVGGGIAAIIGAGCLAGAIILVPAVPDAAWAERGPVRTLW